MNIIKEIRPAKTRDSVSWSRDGGEAVTQVRCGEIAVVRTDCYGFTVARAVDLYMAAREDFSGLDYEDCRIVHFGGVQYRGTFGIEFDCQDLDSVPDGWIEIQELEYTL